MESDAISKKVCLLGDFAVGKTSLVRRFVYDRFDDKYLSTLGVKVSRKLVQVPTAHRVLTVSMMLWDLAGSEEFEKLRASYLRGASGAVLVCDVTRPDTLEHLKSLVDELLRATPDLQIVLAGNKADLIPETRITPEQLEAAAAGMNAPSYLTSAKEGSLVEALFLRMARQLTSQSPAKAP